MVYRGRRVIVTAAGSAPDDLELVPGILPVLVSPETRRVLMPALVPDGGSVPAWHGQPA